MATFMFNNRASTQKPCVAYPTPEPPQLSFTQTSNKPTGWLTLRQTSLEKRSGCGLPPGQLHRGSYTGAATPGQACELWMRERERTPLAGRTEGAFLGAEQSAFSRWVTWKPLWERERRRQKERSRERVRERDPLLIESERKIEKGWERGAIGRERESDK